MNLRCIIFAISYSILSISRRAVLAQQESSSYSSPYSSSQQEKIYKKNTSRSNIRSSTKKKKNVSPSTPTFFDTIPELIRAGSKPDQFVYVLLRPLISPIVEATLLDKIPKPISIINNFRCWADGKECELGKNCYRCCDDPTWWVSNYHISCGIEQCWSTGAFCDRKDTCHDKCCNSFRCPLSVGLCLCL